VTMADTTSDGDPYYRLVSNKKHAKKPRTEQEEPEEPVCLTETSIRITFKKPIKSGTEINVAATVQQLFTTMKSADPLIQVLTLDRQASFRPNNDDFPSNETKFKQFFLVHPRSNNPVYKNQLTIGCILKTAKSISNLKDTEVDNLKLIDWLVLKKIFLEDDTLGHDLTKVIGFLLQVHPRVVNHDALKETLVTKLQAINIDPQQVIDLDSTAADHYQRVMDSGDHVETYVPPFTLFSTVISNTQETKKATTRTVGVKCSAKHHALLRELFTQLFTNPPSEIAYIRFSLSGILTVIGATAYQNLIRDNNKHFDTLATIPIAGITNTHLDLDIPIHDPQDPNKRMTIREILLANDWCSTVETTHIDGRLLLTTTKHNLVEARQWLDENLEPLFLHHLSKNPQFQPHPEFNIPRRTDRISVNSTTQKYAEKLVNSIPTYTNTATDKDKFSKFPTKHNSKNPKYVFDKKEFPKLSKTHSSTTATTSNQSLAQKETNTATSTKQPEKTNTSADKIPIDFKAMQAQIQKNLEKDFTALLNAKFEDFHSDVKDSFAKLDTRYDTLHTDVTELGNMVKMLMTQQQRMHETLESLQNNLKAPSPRRGGDGRA